MNDSACDLLVVTDATASRLDLDALKSSIPEILGLAKLSGAFSRLGVLAYKDYTDAPEEIAAWSGWNTDTLPQFVRDLEPTGGGDFPEAAKTALIRGLQAVDKESKTLVLWYADAPPHHISVKSHENDVAEAKAFPAGAVDWVKLCHTARRRNCTVFTFTPNAMDRAHSSFYVLLSELTGGISISSKAGSKSSTLISRLTLGVILQWMGQGTSDLDEVLRDSGVRLLQYEQSPLVAKPKPTDEELGCAGYLPPSYHSSKGVPLRPILSTPLDTSKIPTGKPAAHLFNLARRFEDASEVGYRDLVYASLTDIIRSNVACLTYNPIFWAAVAEFVGKVNEAERKTALRQWLEESFDRTEEIKQIVARHRENDNGAAVYLDFDADVQLTRTELLEVSRSCYAGVLKKIATIFTHLKLVEPGITLAPRQRSIPLTLPPPDFFRILPHLIVPGTLYPARAAALTAVVALITAVPFLKEPAIELLATAKGKWLDMKVPENISFDCARFLLSAPEGMVLTAKEKRVYGAMQRYKLIELNLDAPLLTNVPWTPQKTRGAGDVKVQCKKCLISRSITIMSHVHADLCGICVTGHVSPAKVPSRYPAVDEKAAGSNAQQRLAGHNSSPLLLLSQWYPMPVARVCYRKRYICPACRNPQWAGKSIVATDSTARTLIVQNGVEWLGFTQKNIFDAFFAGTAPNSNATLTLNNKRVRDTALIIAQVEGRVGRGEVVLSTCALCFEDMPSTKLVPACGRTGCAQLVDEGCLQEWYGKNAPGKLLNMMQFTCPFCRRRPTVKMLTRYNREAVVLGGLLSAMDDARFFYAWCMHCASAKRAYERTSCMEEGIAPITDFRCEDCTPLAPVAPLQNEFEKEAADWAERKIILAAEWATLREQARWESNWDWAYDDRTVVCPNPECGARIEKTHGCNHMICICGTHFCWRCAKRLSPNDVGQHAYREHGAAFHN
ncbi:RING-type domain-containing protein [Mycena venus]|uniref:RBR-type E3 ubiquitin transferase n=1 Tax=Mycena venus TaxID=2733690 RepID=A0A8H7D3X2_9AGAR|nr:RING-type domain-containing protein [Mycena venus]